MKPRTDGYCDVWSDRDYINDIRGGACERCGITNMMSLKLFSAMLHVHHYKSKTDCTPDDLITLCNSCHVKLHAKLRKRQI